MARNHRQVIKIYRERSRELAALNLLSYVNGMYFYMVISEETKKEGRKGYEPEVVKKIIQDYKKTSEWSEYQVFLNKIPCIYNKIKDSIISLIVMSRIQDNG